MRSIAIMNQKGGVGKTTTAVNLSAALADLDQRVCLVDLDPQSHASLHLGVEVSGDEPSTYDVMLGDASLDDTWRQVDDRLWVVASDIDLAAVEVELASQPQRETILRRRLAQFDKPLDFLLIDCPPSLGLLTINAMAAVDEVLIPLQPHFLALHGLSRLLESVGMIAGRLNTRLQVAGVVLCMYDTTTRLAAEVAQDVSDFFTQSQGQPVPWSAARPFETRIRRNIRLAEAPSFGKSIFQYAPRSNGAEDYRQLAGELLQQPR